MEEEMRALKKNHTWEMVISVRALNQSGVGVCLL